MDPTVTCPRSLCSSEHRSHPVCLLPRRVVCGCAGVVSVLVSLPVFVRHLTTANSAVFPSQTDKSTSARTVVSLKLGTLLRDSQFFQEQEIRHRREHHFELLQHGFLFPSDTYPPSSERVYNLVFKGFFDRLEDTVARSRETIRPHLTTRLTS